MKNIIIGVLIAIIVMLFVLFVIAVQYANAQPKVTVSWDPNDEVDLAGYKVYVGEESRDYTGVVDVGNKTSFTWNNLNPDKGDGRYYFAVTAYDLSNNESEFSEERSASLRQEKYTLDIIIQGNGAFIIDPALSTYEPGTIVKIEPTPANNWRFVEFQGPGVTRNGMREVFMDSDKTLTIVFEEMESILRPLAPGFLIAGDDVRGDTVIVKGDTVTVRIIQEPEYEDFSPMDKSVITGYQLERFSGGIWQIAFANALEDDIPNGTYQAGVHKLRARTAINATLSDPSREQIMELESDEPLVIQFDWKVR